MNDDQLGPKLDITLPRPLPDGRDLVGRYCRLTRTHLGHAPALFAGNSLRPAGFDYLFDGPFDDLAAYTDWMQRACLGQDPLFYTVLVDDAPVGIAALMRQAPDHGVIEVGNIHFTTAMQGGRASTEAQYLLMRHAFEDLGYRRYEWKCNDLNAPSKKAALRLGFTYEGTFRQHMVVKGASRDTAWFAILDGDWPAQKDRFVAWLDPSNFDADGQQIAPLARA